MFQKFFLIIFMFLFLGSITILDARTNENTPIYQDITTGVEIEFVRDGSTWNRIRSRGEAYISFDNNRKDIHIATKKAILRAKANIAKFLNERIKSNEVLENITKTLTNTSNNKIKVNRKNIETMKEEISASANQLLKGVLVLEKIVNHQKGYVSVLLGVSRKTMRTSDDIKYNMDKDVSSGIITAPNDIFRSKNYNNF